MEAPFSVKLNGYASTDGRAYAKSINTKTAAETEATICPALLVTRRRGLIQNTQSWQVAFPHISAAYDVERRK